MPRGNVQLIAGVDLNLGNVALVRIELDEIIVAGRVNAGEIDTGAVLPRKAIKTRPRLDNMTAVQGLSAGGRDGNQSNPRLVGTKGLEAQQL